MAAHTCKQCNSIFMEYISNHRTYCSWDCKKKAMERSYHLTCNFCGTDFRHKKWNKQCCSLTCSAKLNNSKIKTRVGNTNSGEKHWNYKGGSLGKNGYIYLSSKLNGRKIRPLQHRVTMEEYLGRILDKKEHVHHINGDKTDNRVENLMVLSASDHAKLHALRRTYG